MLNKLFGKGKNANKGVGEQDSANKIISNKQANSATRATPVLNVSELHKSIVNNAENCISHFKERFGNKLDFSEHSLKLIDNILDEAGEFIEDMTEGKKRWIIEIVGCYILEVARNNYGGQYSGMIKVYPILFRKAIEQGMLFLLVQLKRLARFGAYSLPWKVCKMRGVLTIT